jgi:hypothetical protein
MDMSAPASLSCLLEIFPRTHVWCFFKYLMLCYCSMYYRCYATIARRNMCRLVTAGKHVNDIRDIARQPRITIEKIVAGGVFCLVRPEAI